MIICDNERENKELKEKVEQLEHLNIELVNNIKVS
jgi:hypothetical protein